jgi:putative tryptophan/tyrosine transport system substrate-binding protein
MRRREFIISVGGAPLVWPLAARAQEAGRGYRVAGMSLNPRDTPVIIAMFDELRKLGFREGQNLTIDWHVYDPHTDLVSQFEALAKVRPDVIYTGGPALIRAAQKATTTIPILAITHDMSGPA